MQIPSVTDVSACYHCGLPASDTWTVAVAGAERLFCCPGCRAVCLAIHDAGLEGFYERVREGDGLAPPPEGEEDFAAYDLDDVQAGFVRVAGAEREAELLIEGIHCAACVWLIERRLGRLPGLGLAQVNLAACRLKVRWDPEMQQLSVILRTLASIGYVAVPYDFEAAEGQLQREQRARLYRLAFAGFAMMNLLWISIALYSGADEGEHRALLHWAGWALATPTLLYAGWPFLRGAWSGLRHGYLTMDLPIAIGASVTWLYSSWVMFAAVPGAQVYFDTVVNFLFVILVGRHLEALSRRQALSSTYRLMELQPRIATLVDEQGERTVAVRSLFIGARVRVRPGGQIPADGHVLDGTTTVDEALLSGESVSAVKGPGAPVYAGTQNLDGTITLQVEQLLADTALGRIVRLVESAQSCKAPVQHLADRMVPWFVALTLGLALLTFAAWLDRGLEQALMAAVAVLIVTCPCAFGLATPMAIAVAAGRGARHGILIKSGAALEALARAGRFVFDKTGTLTEGRQAVVDSAWEGVDPDAGLAAAAALEGASEHGIGAAIVAYAATQGLDVDTVEAFRNRPGRGVSGRIAGHGWQVGSPGWLGELPGGARFAARIEEEERAGRSAVLAARDGEVVGLLLLADRVRETARASITALRASGVAVTLLSGDRQRVVEAVAAELGEMEVIAEVLPEEKAGVVTAYQRDGEVVVMVGDGLNDAPALACADVGIALGSGTDVSIDCADLVLTGERLELIGAAQSLARRTLRCVRQNIALSIAYNLVMVPLAMTGLVTPLLAALTMPLSSLAVIGNAARLRRWSPPDGREAGMDETVLDRAEPELEVARWK